MNFFKILKHPNEILNKKAEVVEIFDESLKADVSKMLITMRKHGGIGLAGNQVGLLKRIVVIDTVKADKPKGFLGALINPVIVQKTDKKHVNIEGCLSFPDEAYYVERNQEITVKYQTAAGDYQEKKFTGLTAICIQHEIDHLNGITFDTKAVK